MREIAAMLPDKPQGLGLTYKNREHWNQLLQTPEGQNILKLASESLEKGMPPFVDSLYLHLNKTEIRLPGENMMNARYQYLWRLVLAECMENKKRFLPAIIRGMEELCRQKPWSIPAHDRDLRNYNGTDYYVDLVVATAGNTFAQCVRLLDDRLPIETRALVNCAFREKVFRPIRRCLEETKPFYWFTVKNNWNSVCLAGVTGAALALLPDKEERAYFVQLPRNTSRMGWKDMLMTDTAGKESVIIIMALGHLSLYVKRCAGLLRDRLISSVCRSSSVWPVTEKRYRFRIGFARLTRIAGSGFHLILL